MTGLPEYVRLFTAVEIDPASRRVLRREAQRLLAGAGRMTLVAEENLHVTLKFLGDVHRGDLAALDEVLAEAGTRLAPGTVEIRGIGAFPDLARPRVIWAGVGDPEGILSRVHARLNETLARFGVKRERKRYVPHVTLARVRGPVDAGLLRDRAAGAAEEWYGEQDVERYTLYMSELVRGGPPRYTVMGRYGPGG